MTPAAEGPPLAASTGTRGMNTGEPSGDDGSPRHAPSVARR
eukprot:CAMPEP_0203819200 /NCGR_PEP_ID=MMETSP0115-20131106/34519_1 /ASSEMBLY_ACC=CAM_ASM_000227 /TAXON_ID=33651 /ORGANISM="Bicosoecid sp, Strain ms1" /LENGTH=40 /DNA_ID= /DNA_START= /DNA_END= /DNA_ORIENTATION=